MSENYQYAECKHCGKSVMEGEIHNCRQMLLAEIADCHATMLNQAKRIAEQGKTIVLLENALQKIARVSLEPGHLYNQAVRMQDIARQALADRP